MAYGKFNRIVLNLGYQGQITGDGIDNAVNGCHAVLPVKAKLVAAYISCTACAATAAKISVYQGSTKVVDQFTLTSSTKSGEMTITSSQEGVLFPAGSEFSLKEQTTATQTVDNPSVQLVFRVYEA